MPGFTRTGRRRGRGVRARPRAPRRGRPLHALELDRPDPAGARADGVVDLPALLGHPAEEDELGVDARAQGDRELAAGDHLGAGAGAPQRADDGPGRARLHRVGHQVGGAGEPGVELARLGLDAIQVVHVDGRADAAARRGPQDLRQRGSAQHRPSLVARQHRSPATAAPIRSINLLVSRARGRAGERGGAWGSVTASRHAGSSPRADAGEQGWVPAA